LHACTHHTHSQLPAWLLSCPQATVWSSLALPKAPPLSVWALPCTHSHSAGRYIRWYMQLPAAPLPAVAVAAAAAATAAAAVRMAQWGPCCSCFSHKPHSSPRLLAHTPPWQPGTGRCSCSCCKHTAQGDPAPRSIDQQRSQTRSTLAAAVHVGAIVQQVVSH
jgi:hypothetical protein